MDLYRSEQMPCFRFHTCDGAVLQSFSISTTCKAHNIALSYCRSDASRIGECEAKQTA